MVIRIKGKRIEVKRLNASDLKKVKSIVPLTEGVYWYETNASADDGPLMGPFNDYARALSDAEAELSGEVR